MVTKKLMNSTIARKLPPLDTETTDNSIVHVHYFNPVGAGDWYGMTYSPEERLFFGYVSIFGDYNDELGYFSLDELESLKLSWGRKIERDIYWQPRTLKEVKQEIGGSM